LTIAVARLQELQGLANHVVRRLVLSRLYKFPNGAARLF